MGGTKYSEWFMRERLIEPQLKVAGWELMPSREQQCTDE